MTTEQILVENGLDFTISKRPLFDDQLNPSGYFGLYNDSINKCINTVKDSYHVSQNKDVVDLVLKGIEPFGGELSVSKAGSLNEGRKVFIQLLVEGNSFVGKDTIKKYITILDSNDGSTSLSVGIGDLTMSCQNQFFKFYKQGESKFRHSASLNEKIKEIPMLIEFALSKSMKQVELYKTFESTAITKGLADSLVKDLLGFDREMAYEQDLATRSINKMESLYGCIHEEIQDKGLNLWGLHSGVTKFTTHEISAPKRDNGRLESIINGSGYTMNQKSLEFVSRRANLVI